MALGARGSGDGDFTFRVERFLTPGGRDDDRCVPLGSHQLDGRVDVAYVDETPHSELKLLEAFSIGTHGTIVVGTGGEIAVMRDRERLLGHLVEIENVDRVFGIRYRPRFLGEP